MENAWISRLSSVRVGITPSQPMPFLRAWTLELMPLLGLLVVSALNGIGWLWLHRAERKGCVLFGWRASW
jgi:hypothetical protein